MTPKSHSIGILGGTFDPPHLGHLALAQAALSSAGLDQVLLLPASIPPHKHRPDITAPKHRLAMTRLLCEECNRMQANDIELSRQGKSYSVDTVLSLRALMPGVSFRLIIGEDMAADFHSWREAEKLMRIAPPLVAARPGNGFLANLGGQSNMPGSMRQCLVRSRINLNPTNISSTAIRHAIANGQDAADWLTTKVWVYIQRNELYRVSN